MHQTLDWWKRGSLSSFTIFAVMTSHQSICIAPLEICLGFSVRGLFQRAKPQGHIKSTKHCHQRLVLKWLQFFKDSLKKNSYADAPLIELKTIMNPCTTWFGHFAQKGTMVERLQLKMRCTWQFCNFRWGQVSEKFCAKCLVSFLERIWRILQQTKTKKDCWRLPRHLQMQQKKETRTEI